jgi:hypothetical protein
MSRLSVVVALTAALALAAPAAAHQANPNFLTRVDSITPSSPGLTVDVLNRDDQLALRNGTDQDVIIWGYNDEPYARIAADGTVSVNTRSPAYYLNDDRYGGAKVPDGIDGKDPPQWKVLDRSRRFQWHDHRMHWMAKTRPPQVKNPDKRTTVFHWKVPLSVGDKKGDIAGTLFWTPPPGTPVGFLIVASVLVVVLCAAALVVRRRRDRAAGGESPPAEAW